MMKSSSVIVATAIMIGFVSVLVYRVSASDGPGAKHLPMPAIAADAIGTTASPLKVEFIVQQCGAADPTALPPSALPEMFELPETEEPARLSTASVEIAEQWVSGEGIPEFVLDTAPVAAQDVSVQHSPSFVYIR